MLILHTTNKAQRLVKHYSLQQPSSRDLHFTPRGNRPLPVEQHLLVGRKEGILYPRPLGLPLPKVIVNSY